MKDVKGIRLVAATAFWVAYWGFVFWAARPGHLEGQHHLINAVIVVIGLVAAWLTYLTAARRISWAMKGEDA